VAQDESNTQIASSQDGREMCASWMAATSKKQ